MPRFEIWSEGYHATGMDFPARATLHGVAEGRDFAEACAALADRDPGFAKDFDGRRLTHWGCRLYDNEAGARETFG